MKRPERTERTIRPPCYQSVSPMGGTDEWPAGTTLDEVIDDEVLCVTTGGPWDRCIFLGDRAVALIRKVRGGRIDVIRFHGD